MDKFVEICLKEYDNLWGEKLVHKNSLRKFQNYIVYLATLSSLAITIAGLSYFDIIIVGGDQPVKIHPIIHILCLIYIPIVLVSIGFVLNDMFQLYVIARQIEAIETKINRFVGNQQPLSWESSICNIVFAGAKVHRASGEVIKIANIIRINNWPLFIFIGTSFFLSVFLGYSYLLGLCEKDTSFIYIALVYSAVFAGCVVPVILGGMKLNSYTKAKSSLRRTIILANSPREEITDDS